MFGKRTSLTYYGSQNGKDSGERTRQLFHLWYRHGIQQDTVAIFVHQFLQHQLLERDARHGSLRVTEKGWDVINRGDQFCGLPVDSVDRATSEVSPEYALELFELLRAERDRIAEAEGVLPYEVFHDKALQAMATYFPTSEESFRLTSGVGPMRSEKYINIFLPIIREYFKKHGIGSAKARPKERTLMNRYLKSQMNMLRNSLSDFETSAKQLPMRKESRRFLSLPIKRCER